MNFSAKSEIFQSLRKGMADEIVRCKSITGAKTKKTAPINKKLWDERLLTVAKIYGLQHT